MIRQKNKPRNENWTELAYGSVKAIYESRFKQFLSEEMNIDEYYDSLMPGNCIVEWKLRYAGDESDRRFRMEYNICMANGRHSSPSNIRGKVDIDKIIDVCDLMNDNQSGKKVLQLIEVSSEMPKWTFEMVSPYDYLLDETEIMSGSFSSEISVKKQKFNKCTVGWRLRGPELKKFSHYTSVTESMRHSKMKLNSISMPNYYIDYSIEYSTKDGNASINGEKMHISHELALKIAADSKNLIESMIIHENDIVKDLGGQRRKSQYKVRSHNVDSEIVMYKVTKNGSDD